MIRSRKRPSARLPRTRPGGTKRRVWFFDLDDTLHDASHAMFGAIDTRMTDFVRRHLQIDHAAADALRQSYWKRYGATLLGLVRHHGVNPQRFLRETHDFDVTSLLRVERGLRQLGRPLAGRKVLLTNAPDHYAGRVLRGIGLHRHIRTRYAVESMRVHGHIRPKPSVSMLRAMLVREGLGGRHSPARAILVDDNVRNLKAARSVGFATVLLQRKGGEAPRRLTSAAFVTGRIASVRQLPALAARMGWLGKSAVGALAACGERR